MSDCSRSEAESDRSEVKKHYIAILFIWVKLFYNKGCCSIFVMLFLLQAAVLRGASELSVDLDAVRL